MSEENKTPLLEVKDLKKWFPAKSSPFSKEKVFIKAVDGVSFTLNAGETLGVVGESGCGKSTMGRSVLRLLEPTDGQVLFEGKDYTALKSSELAKSRSDLQIIFQDPYASLDPRMTIGDIIGEPLDIQLKLPTKERMERVLKTMERVGLNTRYVNRYPHEFSGGQRQRIGIARAIVLGPKLMVCDEPVSALDVSVQAQVLNLLMDLQKEMGMAYIFISHDLSVIKHISDRIMVMYLGHVVELFIREQCIRIRQHCYRLFRYRIVNIKKKKSFWREICQARRIHHQVVYSTPDVIKLRKSVRRRYLNFVIVEMVIAVHAIFRKINQNKIVFQ